MIGHFQMGFQMDQQARGQPAEATSRWDKFVFLFVLQEIQRYIYDRNTVLTFRFRFIFRSTQIFTHLVLRKHSLIPFFENDCLIHYTTITKTFTHLVSHGLSPCFTALLLRGPDSAALASRLRSLRHSASAASPRKVHSLPQFDPEKKKRIFTFISLNREMKA